MVSAGTICLITLNPLIRFNREMIRGKKSGDDVASTCLPGSRVADYKRCRSLKAEWLKHPQACPEAKYPAGKK